jgi:hypothetical protein
LFFGSLLTLSPELIGIPPSVIWGNEKFGFQCDDGAIDGKSIAVNCISFFFEFYHLLNYYFLLKISIQNKRNNVHKNK